MTFDVKPLLRGEVGRIAVDCSFSVEPITGVSFDEDAHAVGEITDNGGYMRLRLHLVGHTSIDSVQLLQLPDEFLNTVIGGNQVLVSYRILLHISSDSFISSFKPF